MRRYGIPELGYTFFTWLGFNCCGIFEITTSSSSIAATIWKRREKMAFLIDTIPGKDAKKAARLLINCCERNSAAFSLKKRYELRLFSRNTCIYNLFGRVMDKRAMQKCRKKKKIVTTRERERETRWYRWSRIIYQWSRYARHLLMLHHIKEDHVFFLSLSLPFLTAGVTVNSSHIYKSDQPECFRYFLKREREIYNFSFSIFCRPLSSLKMVAELMEPTLPDQVELDD